MEELYAKEECPTMGMGLHFHLHLHYKSIERGVEVQGASRVASVPSVINASSVASALSVSRHFARLCMIAMVLHDVMQVN